MNKQHAGEGIVFENPTVNAGCYETDRKTAV